jgi:hypothetical protein
VKPTKQPEDRRFDERIFKTITISMSGWPAIETFANQCRTNIAKIRPHLDRLETEGSLISRIRSGHKEWTLAPVKAP